MVRRDRASIFHGFPVRPPGNLVANLPDFLTPNNIFKIERSPIVHDPLGNRSTRFGPNLKHSQVLMDPSFERILRSMMNLPRPLTSTSYPWPCRNSDHSQSHMRKPWYSKSDGQHLGFLRQSSSHHRLLSPCMHQPLERTA